MVAEEIQGAANIASRAVGGFYLVKNILTAIGIIIVATVLMIFGVAWYIIILIALLFLFFIFLAIRRSYQATTGTGPPIEHKITYNKGKGFSTRVRY